MNDIYVDLNAGGQVINVSVALGGVTNDHTQLLNIGSRTHAEIDAELDALAMIRANLLSNGNFINNSTNGYGNTSDDWVNLNANTVQGGFPEFTKQQLIDILGITDSQLKGYWPLNGDFNDKSSNGYNLTPSGSPTDDSNGLCGTAKKFVAASNQYASITHAAGSGLELISNQSYVCWVKPTSIGSGVVLFAKDNASVKRFIIQSSGVLEWLMPGLSTTNGQSDIILEANKWYMVAFIYDFSAGKFKVWINGVKKEWSTTGSATTGTGDFRIAAQSSSTLNLNGLMQGACVFSTALSDEQVKRLWAATTWKGTKTRRAGSDGYLSQLLPTYLTERLRGKTIVLRASIYQKSASTGQIFITDNSGTTYSNTINEINEWKDIYVVKTISANATGISLGIKHSAPDSNIFWKEFALYEGGSLLPYVHSAEDWSRFPILLRQIPPADTTGYRYEENREYVQNNIKTSSGMSIGNGNIYGYYTHKGIETHYWGGIEFGSTTSVTSEVAAIIPAAYELESVVNQGIARFFDSGTSNYPGVSYLTTGNRIRFYGTTSSYATATTPFTWTTSDGVFWDITYKRPQ